MSGFDKKIKKMSKDFQVPEDYHHRVDEILKSFQENHVSAPKRKTAVRVAIVVLAVCLIVTGYLSFSNAKVAEASLFRSFRQTIMDFFGLEKDEPQELGIESTKEEAVSKLDLMIELQEVVIDTQSIYAVIKITAPPEIEFREGMTFDYFGFCEGTNYNQLAVIPGSRECRLLEVMEGKSNVARYVVNVSTDKKVKEDKDVTVFFKDLIAGPYEDKPDILVEGMWSLSFLSTYTSTKELTVKGTKDMKYSFAGTTADIKKVKLRPLGFTLLSDVSRVDTDTLNTTDTRFVIRLKMLDGSEVIVDSPNLEDDCLVNGGSIGTYDKKGHTYQKYVGQFKKAIDINQVMGMYIADYYVPFKEYE